MFEQLEKTLEEALEYKAPPQAEVVEIKSVMKTPGSDRLHSFNVHGWTVISSNINQTEDSFGEPRYKVGDKVIYISIDSVLPPQLESYLFPVESKIKLEGGRVRTLKLRGAISQGMIVDNTQELWNLYNLRVDTSALPLGEDVSKALQVTKYEPPASSVPNGMRGGQIAKRNPLFKEYTDIRHLKWYTDKDVFQDGEPLYVTEKLHGCVSYNTKISLANGDKMTIKQIVDNKIEGPVLGMDQQGRLVSTKIINWFNNGKSDDWRRVRFTRHKAGGGNHYGSVISTAKHLFLVPSTGTYVRADELKSGDELFVQRIEGQIPFWQQQILIGKMLGDGTLSGNAVQFGHKQANADYVKYTLDCLGDLGNKHTRAAISGYGTTMVRAQSKADWMIREFFEPWFVAGKKQVPDDLIEYFSPIALAFMYMDDGSLAHHEGQEDRAYLATCGFNENSIDNILAALKSNMKINGVKFQADNYWRIRLNADDANKMFALIHPFIPLSMQYKLPEMYRTGKMPNVISTSTSYKSNLSVQTVIGVDIVPGQVEYDIETETHNYLANSVVTHNTSARYAYLPTHVNTLWKKILRFFRLLPKFEYCFGSRRVQLQDKAKDHKGFYVENVYRIVGEQYDLKNKLSPGQELFGEIVGSGIQKNYTYGCKEGEYKFFAYDLMCDGKFMDPLDFMWWCDTMQITRVPWLDQSSPKNPTKYSLEALDVLRAGDSLIGNQKVREGIVVKPLAERSHPAMGRVVVKYINDKYLLAENSDFH